MIKVLDLARMAQAVYNDREYKIAAMLDKMGYTGVQFYDRGETQGFLAQGPQLNVVCFRGTSFNGIDILRDIDFFPKRITRGGLHAHAGFVRALGQILGYKWGAYGNIDVVWSGRPHMVNDIAKLPRDKPVVFTGHSLGAALAALAAYRIHLEDITNIKVVGFGCPKFASRELARDFDDREIDFQRFIHGADIINRFPPTPRLKHCGKAVYIGRRPSRRPITDHRIQNYIDVLDKLNKADPTRYKV